MGKVTEKRIGASEKSMTNAQNREVGLILNVVF